MYIVVHHRVVDQQKFLATDPNDIGGNAPAGVDVFHFLPARDASAADCLWEAPSVAALRDYLDPATRGICENEYFEVDAKLAKGLLTWCPPGPRSVGRDQSTCRPTIPDGTRAKPAS